MTSHYQKRHYFEIAELLGQTTRDGSMVIEAFVQLFKRDNSLFREQQFREEVKLQRYMNENNLVNTQQARKAFAKLEVSA